MSFFKRRYITRRELDEEISKMATQAEVDTLTAQVTQLASDLANATSKLQAEVNALEQPISLAALQAAVAPIPAQVEQLAAIVPQPPPAA